jgi:hypothetical protein
MATGLAKGWEGYWWVPTAQNANYNVFMYSGQSSTSVNFPLRYLRLLLQS